MRNALGIGAPHSMSRLIYLHDIATTVHHKASTVPLRASTARLNMRLSKVTASRHHRYVATDFRFSRQPRLPRAKLSSCTDITRRWATNRATNKDPLPSNVRARTADASRHAWPPSAVALSAKRVVNAAPTAASAPRCAAKRSRLQLVGPFEDQMNWSHGNIS